MIDSRIRIADGLVKDFYSEFGFIYIDADERTEAPVKQRDATSYAEQAGENLDTRTVPDAFDYTAKFLIECPNRNFENANALIDRFNKAIYEQQPDSDIRTYKEIAFFNLHNRVLIVGCPDPIAQPTEFYRRSDGSVADCVMVELKIRVSNPLKCDFNLSDPFLRIGDETRRIRHVYLLESAETPAIAGFAAEPIRVDENGDPLNPEAIVGFSFSDIETSGIFPDLSAETIYIDNSPQWLAYGTDRLHLKFRDEETGIDGELDTAGAIGHHADELNVSAASLFDNRLLTLRAESLMNRNQ